MTLRGVPAITGLSDTVGNMASGKAVETEQLLAELLKEDPPENATIIFDLHRAIAIF